MATGLVFLLSLARFFQISMVANEVIVLALAVSDNVNELFVVH